MATIDYGFIQDFITNITLAGGEVVESGALNTYNVTTAEGNAFTFQIQNGNDGKDGEGIYSLTFANVTENNFRSICNTMAAKARIILRVLGLRAISGGYATNELICDVSQGTMSLYRYVLNDGTWAELLPTDFASDYYGLVFYLCNDNMKNVFPEPDSTLENNPWELIAYWIDKGQAANFWSLGATKTDLGTDGVTRTFRICDMQGLYDKKVVFESLYCEPGSSIFSDSIDYATSGIRENYLPLIYSCYSQSLQNFITNTTYKTGKWYVSGYGVQILTDKLFLPAARELFSSNGTGLQPISMPNEWNALTMFSLYAENDNANFRTKRTIYDPPERDRMFWLRSPSTGSSKTHECVVYDGYLTTASITYSAVYVAPLFSR